MPSLCVTNYIIKKKYENYSHICYYRCVGIAVDLKGLKVACQLSTVRTILSHKVKTEQRDSDRKLIRCISRVRGVVCKFSSEGMKIEKS